MVYYYYIKEKLNQERGASGGGIGVIMAGFLLLAAYMIYPEVFHDFFQYIREQFFQNLDNSFKENPYGEGGGSAGENKGGGGK